MEQASLSFPMFYFPDRVHTHSFIHSPASTVVKTWSSNTPWPQKAQLFFPPPAKLTTDAKSLDLVKSTNTLPPLRFESVIGGG